MGLEREEAIKRLRQLLRPGDTVYTVLRHVSRSGMLRRIDLYAVKGKRPMYLSGYAAAAMGRRVSDKPGGGIAVGGCGKDVGFSLVYNLGRTLFPKGFKLRKGQYGRNGDTSEYDPNGGYALKHEWM